LAALLIGGACTAAQEAPSASEPAASQEDSKYRQTENQEMVEVKIRMPDGRVIVRKERRNASRIDPNHPIATGERPAVVRKDGGDVVRKGDVRSTNAGASGGSNGSSGSSAGGASGGGGGGSSATRGAHSGGGGGARGTAGGDGTGGADGDGASDSSVITPVQPDSDLTTRLYAWENSGAPFDNVTTTIKTAPWSRGPEQLAEAIARVIRNQQPDRIVLRFWKEFHFARDPWDPTNPRELISSGGYTDEAIDYWSTFAVALRDEGITPDYLVFDQEDGIGFWNIAPEHRREFFGELVDPDRPLIAGLPESMHGVDLDAFIAGSGEGAQPRRDYNQFAHEFRADLIRRVFMDTFEQAYGTRIHASNYWDVIPSDPVMRFYDGEQPAASIAGISAPVAYIEYMPQSNRYRNAEKDPRWNRLIDKLNNVRSTAQPGWTTPWIAPPGYGRNGPDSWARASQLEEEYWLWDTMMSHMTAMGVDTFILWNPSSTFNPNAVATDAYMDDWLGGNPRVPHGQLRDLNPIPLDADEIVTNGAVTTYDEFLDNMTVAPNR